MVSTMPEGPYSLAWPADLFEWEAKRVINSQRSDNVPLLLTEAFVDADIERDYLVDIGIIGGGAVRHRPMQWLQDLLQYPDLTRPYQGQVYWAQRHGLAAQASASGFDLASQFGALLTELQGRGYFPTALPRECVDDRVSWEAVSARARAATHVDVSLPLTVPALNTMDLDTIYTLIEYFHDEAQRPRRIERMHDYANCGAHYGAYNRESGSVVYRWRINQILDAVNAPVRMSAAPQERGRLVRVSRTPLDDLAEAELEGRGHDPADEVAHAIQTYRARDAGLPQKRAALALLAGVLESRRGELKTVLKDDERDLFNIANNFAIRHRNANQRTEYGEDFLDWIFWGYLSTAALLSALDVRPGSE